MPIRGLDSLRRRLEDIDKPYNDALRTILMQSLGNIAAGTPVDEGRARSNWFLKIGSPSTEVTDSTDGNDHLDRMPNRVLGRVIYYANNLPYINALEYGGYRGVGDKTIAASGGIYSDQAAGGWVRGELMRMQSAIRNIR